MQSDHQFERQKNQYSKKQWWIEVVECGWAMVLRLLLIIIAMWGLLNKLACGFYKTKWQHYLQKKSPTTPPQVPIKRWNIVRGDVVKLRAGDDRGKIGKVVKVLRKLNRIVVKGVNIHEYTKQVEGKKIRQKKASSMHISNVGLYDDSVKKAVTIKIAFHPETGERLRISKKSGRILYKTKSMKLKRDKRGRKRKLGLKDTPYLIVQKVTYLGEDFEAIRREFEAFIAEKEAREKHLVFKE